MQRVGGPAAMLTVIATVACGGTGSERAAAPAADPLTAQAESPAPALSAPPPQPLTFRREEVDGNTHLLIDPGGLDLGVIEFRHLIVGEIDLCGKVPGFKKGEHRPVLAQEDPPTQAPVTIVELNRPNATRAIIFVTNEARPRIALELSLPQLDPNLSQRGGWELVKPSDPSAPLEALVSITHVGCTPPPTGGECRGAITEDTTYRPRGIDCR
jgi:hypothetical protein